MPLLLFFATPTRAQEPADRLVALLGAPRFADREQATRDLEALGPPALPALRRARQNPDPEVRGRAVGLVQKIAFDQAMTPTRVTLDFQERPLRDILSALEERSGIPIVLDPRAGVAVASRALTLEAVAPPTFWEAIDRLGTLARLRDDLRPLSRGEGTEVRSTLVLEEAGDRLAPAVNWGPFRLKLQGLAERRELSLDPAARPLGDEPPPPPWTLACRLHLSAEPRLSITQGGPVRLENATDDQGRSLLSSPPPPRVPGLALDFPARPPEFSGNPEMTFSIPLSPSGERLGRSFSLEGVLPVAVAALGQDPLEIPLNGAVGKTFEGDDLALTIVSVGQEPGDGRAVLELSARPLVPLTGEDSPPALASTLLDRRIEVLDGRRARLPIALQRAEAEGASLRFRVVVLPTPEAGSPSRLRYVSLLQGTVEMPFSFRDVPLP